MLEGQKTTSVETGVFQKAQRFWLCLFHFVIFHLWRCQVSPMQKWKGTHPASVVTCVAHNTFSSQYQLTKSQLVVACRWQVWDTKWRTEGQFMHFLFLHVCLEQGILQTTVWLQLTVFGCVKPQNLKDRIKHWLVNHNKQSLRQLLMSRKRYCYKNCSCLPK